MRIALTLTVVLLPVLAAGGASAIEVGDVVALGKGVGETVLTVKRRDRETVELTARALAANASEYCDRYEQLTTGTPKWKKCVRENASDRVSTMAVNCRTATIILAGGPGSGSYRPGAGGGPWTSVANPDWIIQGDGLYRQVCGRR